MNLWISAADHPDWWEKALWSCSPMMSTSTTTRMNPVSMTQRHRAKKLLVAVVYSWEIFFCLFESGCCKIVGLKNACVVVQVWCPWSRRVGRRWRRAVRTISCRTCLHVGAWTLSVGKELTSITAPGQIVRGEWWSRTNFSTDFSTWNDP